MSEIKDWGDEPPKDGSDVPVDKPEKKSEGPPPGWEPSLGTIKAISGVGTVGTDSEKKIDSE